CMRQRAGVDSVRFVAVAVACGVLILSWAMKRAAAQEDKPVEQTRKNIQVLKGLPDSQLFMVMNFMRASLGVNCAFCHVNNGGDKWEWEKDDKPEKQTARRMIQMVFDINNNHFKGAHRVSCYTCHRGAEHTVNAPPLPQVAPEGGAAGEEKPRPAMPTAEQLIDKYWQAIGGRAAIEKAKTRVMKGTQTSSANGQSMPLEILQSAPNKFVITVTTPQQAAIMRGYNGTTAWMRSPRGQRELTGADLEQAKRTADFYWMLKLKELTKELRVTGKDKIGDREAYILTARIAPTHTERYYFDTQTGFLLRVITLEDSLIGWIPEQTDYEDYRDVDGVKMPFTVRQSYVDPWVGWTRKFTEIKSNAPVDDKKFDMPAAK
ncbi:MAG: c-type cytochrome, partial [Acidobacteria bacterium]|nr:c-type cytochrome [Acidobacteriota bacterium]